MVCDSGHQLQAPVDDGNGRDGVSSDGDYWEDDPHRDGNDGDDAALDTNADDDDAKRYVVSRDVVNQVQRLRRWLVTLAPVRDRAQAALRDPLDKAALTAAFADRMHQRNTNCWRRVERRCRRLAKAVDAAARAEFGPHLSDTVASIVNGVTRAASIRSSYLDRRIKEEADIERGLKAWVTAEGRRIAKERNAAARDKLKADNAKARKAWQAEHKAWKKGRNRGDEAVPEPVKPLPSKDYEHADPYRCKPSWAERRAHVDDELAKRGYPKTVEECLESDTVRGCGIACQAVLDMIVAVRRFCDAVDAAHRQLVLVRLPAAATVHDAVKYGLLAHVITRMASILGWVTQSTDALRARVGRLTTYCDSGSVRTTRVPSMQELAGKVVWTDSGRGCFAAAYPAMVTAILDNAAASSASWVPFADALASLYGEAAPTSPVRVLAHQLTMATNMANVLPATRLGGGAPRAIETTYAKYSDAWTFATSVRDAIDFQLHGDGRVVATVREYALARLNAPVRSLLASITGVVARPYCEAIAALLAQRPLAANADAVPYHDDPFQWPSNAHMRWENVAKLPLLSRFLCLVDLRDKVRRVVADFGITRAGSAASLRDQELAWGGHLRDIFANEDLVALRAVLSALHISPSQLVCTDADCCGDRFRDLPFFCHHILLDVVTSSAMTMALGTTNDHDSVVVVVPDDLLTPDDAARRADQNADRQRKFAAALLDEATLVPQSRKKPKRQRKRRGDGERGSGSGSGSDSDDGPPTKRRKPSSLPPLGAKFRMHIGVAEGKLCVSRVRMLGYDGATEIEWSRCDAAYVLMHARGWEPFLTMLARLDASAYGSVTGALLLPLRLAGGGRATKGGSHCGAGWCGMCNRPLTTDKSKERGIGPECVKKSHRQALAIMSALTQSQSPPMFKLLDDGRKLMAMETPWLA
jgi:hypothetical protein